MLCPTDKMDVFFLVFCFLLVAQSPSVRLYVAPEERYVMHRDPRISRLSKTTRSMKLRVKHEAATAAVIPTEGPPGIGKLKTCFTDSSSAARVDVSVETHDFVNETHRSMEVQWVGDSGKNILALATSTQAVLTFVGIRKLVSPSRLWRSSDGRTFRDISSSINKDTILDSGGMLKSPVDPAYVILIVYNRSRIYVSSDSGHRFLKVDPLFTVHSIKFHSKDKNYLLALSLKGTLHYSQNFGISWRMLMTGGTVEKYEWADPARLPYSAYATVVKSGESGQSLADFHRFSNLNNPANIDTKVAFAGIHQFVSEGKFIILSSAENRKRFPEIRGLNVSEDGGETWNRVQLPEASLNDFYHILDASEGLILLHVSIGSQAGHGTIYSSDGSGVHFVSVLTNHVFSSGVTDFYKVKSVRGTYITTVVVPDKNKVLQSMISFDRGGRWQALNPPASECAGAKECQLHLHHYFSKQRGVNVTHGVISHANAPGLIMAHGNVGLGLKYDSIGVYVSQDGGYNWKRVFDGAYHYAIADSGGLLLAVPALGGGWAQSKIYYSFDWGSCWHWTTFISERFHFTGLLIEPTLASTDAAVWGYTTDDSMWHVNTLDFKSILRRPCTSSDYDEFVPHLAGNTRGCLFGYKETIFRRSRDKLCYGGKEYQPHATNTTCRCTQFDFECDYGYHNNYLGHCVKEPNFLVPKSMYCPPGQKTYHKTLGYRFVPGDMCKGGVVDQFISQQTEACSGTSAPKSKVKQHFPTNHDSNQVERKKKGGVNVAAAVLIPLALIVLVVVAIVYYKKCYRRESSKFDYKYSMLAQEHEYSRKDLLTGDDDDDDDD